MDMQTAFDTMCRAIIAQGRPSVKSNGDCAYRGTDGTKCAIGVLIPDEKYIPDMERYAVYDVIHQVLGVYEPDAMTFLRDCQAAHDDAANVCYDDEARFVGLFKEYARDVANKWELDSGVLN